jgi:hypothetical protein
LTGEPRRDTTDVGTTFRSVDVEQIDCFDRLPLLGRSPLFVDVGTDAPGFDFCSLFVRQQK